MRCALNKFQRMLWQYAELYPVDYYNLGLSFFLSKSLNPNILEEAFSYLVRLTDSLHAVLVEEQGEYWLETENTSRYDFRHATGEYSLEQCAEDMKAFTKEAFDLTIQQPIRVKLYKLNDGTWMLCVVFHHICIDGVSVVDLLNLWAEIYDSLDEAGVYPELEISSLQACANAMMQYEKPSQMKVALDYWHEMLNGKSQNIQLLEMASSISKDYEYDYVPLK